MNESTLRGLWVALPTAAGVAPSAPPVDGAGFGPFEWAVCEPDAAAARIDQSALDLLVVTTPWEGWAPAAGTLAVVLVRDGMATDATIAALRAGAQDVLPSADAALPGFALRLRAAVERHRLRLAMRQSFATDVQTGLPHEGQLMEHMSHLLALREREPAPMALLVLRIEGFATTAARLGVDAAGALRRKVAVRLRAGVRASDVVASLGADSFAVLLSSIDAPGDGQRVGAKLQAALAQPFRIATDDVALATALGIAASPADGTQPAVLLRRAVGLAASAQAQGRAGFTNHVEGGEPGAANDD